jgi:hypothetical protein
VSISQYLAVKPEADIVRVISQELISEKSLAITLGGLNWDADSAIKPRMNDGQLRFLLEGVRENTLSVGNQSSEIELSFEHPILWDYGPTASIFGNAPLPDPPKFYFDFHDLVSFRLGVPRDPNTYLNFTNSLDEWLAFVYSRTFQLLRAPKVIASKAGQLLENQAADFTLLPDDLEEDKALAVLVLGDSWVVFESGGAVQGSLSDDRD